MNSSTNPFTSLADRAERGDNVARSQLRRKLEPEMVHIVRRVIQEGRGRTVLDRRILAEARSLGLETTLGSREERERLIHAVAERVCSSVVSHLRREDEPAAEETVCNTRGMGMRMLG